MKTKKPSLDRSPSISWIRTILLMITLQGLVVLPFLVRMPSMQRSSWLFGFSPLRLLIFLLFGSLILGFIIFTVRFFIKKEWSRIVSDKLHQFLKNPKNYWPIQFCSVMVIVVGCTSIIIFNLGQDALTSSIYGVIYLRLQPIFIWLTLTTLEFSLYLKFILKKNTPDLDNRHLSITIATISITVVIAFIHWLTIFLDLPWIYNLKHWYWVYIDKGGIYGWRFVILLIITLLVFYLVYRHLRSTKLGLAVLMVCGYLLIVGFGYVRSDNGFDALRKIHLNEINQVEYSYFASHRWVTPWLVITQYEDLTTNSLLCQQKPPGTIFTYSIFQKVSEALLHPDDNISSRLEKLSQVISIIYPLMTVLALLPLYKVARHFLDERQALIPCMFYLIAPNVLLMPLGLDKALYPGLFLVGLYLILKASEQRTFVRCLWTGIFLYVALFFSFSLVPLLFLVFLWFLVHGFDQNRKAMWTHVVRPLGYIGLGFLLSVLVFWIVLNYDIVTRYMVTLDYLRQVSHFEYTFSYLSEVIYGLNVEIAAWSGFPLILIAGIQVLASTLKTIRNRPNEMDAFLFVFLIVYIFLNLFCQLNTENGRTWLFLESVFALATGYFISRSSSLRVPAIISLVILQLVTTFLLISYQYP